MKSDTERLWREYHTRLLGFIEARVRDPATSEDILQEVFLKVHSRIETLRDSNKLESWVYQITRNAIIDHYRSRRASVELPEAVAALEEDPTDRERREMAGCLLPMVESLPESYRDAVKLSEIEGLTQSEVAVRNGLSLSGAKSRVQRGRAMLKSQLQECCQFEFDRRGQIVDYKERSAGSCNCGKDSAAGDSEDSDGTCL